MKIHFFLSSLLLLGACQSPISQTPSETLPTALATTVTTLTVGEVPHGIAANDQFVYNANIGDGTLSIIDSHSDKIIKTLSTEPASPGYIKASYDGKYMLMIDSEGYLTIFEPGNDHKQIQRLMLGKGADKLQISKDNKHVYASLDGESAIAHYYFPEGLGMAPEAKDLISVGSGSPEGKGHRALAYSNQWLLTANPGDNSASLVSPEGVSRILRDGNSPGPVGLGYADEKLHRAIVGNSASHTITLFDSQSDDKVTLNDVGQSPTDMVMVPELGRAYVTMAGSNQVAVIDYVNAKHIGSVDTQQRPVHIYVAPDTSEQIDDMHVQHEGHGHAPEIWVGNDGGDSVTVFDAQTLEVKAHHPTGVGHHKIAFSHNKVYVSNIKDNTITVIKR